MSEKRYNTDADKEEILKGLEFFQSSENPDLINPREIKDLMDKLELKKKMGFIYELIDSLCSNRDIRRKGGLTKDEFIAFLEDKVNDSESKEGIHNLYDVFTDSSNDTLPMTTFCQTARQIGDTQKDQELKELLENADMTGRELTFDEYYEIMKNDDTNPVRNYKKTQPKNDNLYSNRYTRKNYGEKENEEPSEEKNSKRSSYRSKKIGENENEPKGYSYKRVKVEQTKNNKPEKPVVVQFEETTVTKEEEPGDDKFEKKVLFTEIITTEEKIEAPPNDARDRYKYINQDKKGDERNKKVYSYQINKKVVTQKEEEADNNEDKGEGSDSKRYHRRYRASNRPTDQKTESNVTYNRYRRKI